MTNQVIPAEAVEAVVTQIRPRATETFVCPCGSQWLSLHYRMDVDGRIIERSGVATCDGGCGRKHEVTK
jgi:hypothetical protein